MGYIKYLNRNDMIRRDIRSCSMSQTLFYLFELTLPVCYKRESTDCSAGVKIPPEKTPNLILHFQNNVSRQNTHAPGRPTGM